MVAVDLPPYLLLPLLVIPFVFLALSRRKDPQQRLRLPPAPWALPVIGHIHHLAGGAPPHRALRDLARRHGQLMMLRFCELTVVVASSPAAAREILKTHDVTFASRPVGPMLELAFQSANGVIFAPYGEGWRQLRKICAVELLSSRRVHSFFPVRDHELRRLLRSVASAAAAARTPVNLTSGLKAFAADSTVRAIIGGRSEHRDAFLRLLEEALKIIPGMTLPDLFPSSRLAMMLSRVPRKVKQRRDGMLAIIDPIIQEHQDRRAAGVDDEDEDLLDVLLRLQEDMDFQEPLTTANIKSESRKAKVPHSHRDRSRQAAMAVDLPLYLLLALLLAIPVILFTARRSASRGNGASVRLPPSPWAFPVIGHLHHLAGALPHRALRDLARRHGPLMSLRLGELRAVVATSPAAAREIMKAHDAAFASGPLSPMMELGYHGADGIIFAPYGEGWRQLRKICALELLSARRVHSFRHVRADELRPLLLSVDAAAAVASPAVNLGELVAAYVADATVRAIIGSRFRERDEYLRLLQEGLKIMPGMTLPDLFPSSRLARIVSSVPGR
ncbi:hypothetical protein HU200_000340 [Digitaria exilis]|uniref:Cytochrome P450 n=1 Tax=Digitaria exilis TaxID=1010633 RepID=A0A835G1Z4_9POAL|nr:hypothetical protein HU200_000340 [Digitaria exilis]